MSRCIPAFPGRKRHPASATPAPDVAIKRRIVAASATSHGRGHQKRQQYNDSTDEAHDQQYQVVLVAWYMHSNVPPTAKELGAPLID